MWHHRPMGWHGGGWRPGGRRILSIGVLAAALTVPGVAHAGTLTYNASTRVLTYTGSSAANTVFAEHPSEADKAHVQIVDVTEQMTRAGAQACVPDDIDFRLICPTPAKLVLNLGGGEDFFGDESPSSGTPIAVPVEADGGAGNDIFDGGEGADTLRGGLGNDEIFGDGGNDTITGADGDDTIDAGDGDDTVDGGVAKDHLTGGAGQDTVRGGDGDDELDYSPLYALDGRDIFEGGTGHDAVGYFGRTVPVSITLDGQPNDGQAGEGDNIGADIEEVDGGDADDVLVGSAGANGLAGRSGDDRISGLGGNDILYGDTGVDTIDGGDGNDTLDGGCMDDTITGGPGVDAFNADGTCADPVLRGMNDVLNARDGVKDALLICTISGTPGDTAIVDPVDPTPTVGQPGACRTIDAGATAPSGGGTTPGGRPSGGATSGATTSGGTPSGGTTTGGTTTANPTTTPSPGATELKGTLRARLGSTLRLLAGTGQPGQAVRQLAKLKARPAALTLGSLVASSTSRLTVSASIGSGARRVSLGSTRLIVKPGTPRALRVRLSVRGKTALKRMRNASIKVKFVVRPPTGTRISHQSTKTFRITVQR